MLKVHCLLILSKLKCVPEERVKRGHVRRNKITHAQLAERLMPFIAQGFVLMMAVLILIIIQGIKRSKNENLHQKLLTSHLGTQFGQC